MSHPTAQPTQPGQSLPPTDAITATAVRLVPLAVLDAAIEAAATPGGPLLHEALTAALAPYRDGTATTQAHEVNVYFPYGDDAVPVMTRVFADITVARAYAATATEETTVLRTIDIETTPARRTAVHHVSWTPRGHEHGVTPWDLSAQRGPLTASDLRPLIIPADEDARVFPSTADPGCTMTPSDDGSFSVSGTDEARVRATAVTALRAAGADRYSCRCGRPLPGTEVTDATGAREVVAPHEASAACGEPLPVPSNPVRRPRS